jgi:hypothetical protein
MLGLDIAISPAFADTTDLACVVTRERPTLSDIAAEPGSPRHGRRRPHERLRLGTYLFTPLTISAPKLCGRRGYAEGDRPRIETDGRWETHGHEFAVTPWGTSQQSNVATDVDLRVVHGIRAGA